MLHVIDVSYSAYSQGTEHVHWDSTGAANGEPVKPAFVTFIYSHMKKLILGTIITCLLPRHKWPFSQNICFR